ncbi:MAG TPA: DUF6787 family protein [Cyclobacteriaceae bacterium]|nr:DUF6787 family protein [Cyclobacteriaceae bacterium]
MFLRGSRSPIGYLVFPVYNLFLLFYGFVFGQIHFFWNFEKRFLGRIFSIFKR